MKALKRMGVAAAAALTLLTSCLGDGNQSVSSTCFAVAGVSSKNYKTVLNTTQGAFYSAGIENKVMQGACYQISYDVDLSSAENANAAANGYYTAAITVGDEITKAQASFYNVPDTTRLVDSNELALKNVGASSQLGVYVDGYLFLGLTVDQLKDQRNSYTLYWDRAAQPVTEDNVPTYNLYLRALKTAEGTGSTVTSQVDVRAFEMKQVLESVNNQESNKGSESFNLKVNYIETINEKDSTDLTWKSLTIPFYVSKES